MSRPEGSDAVSGECELDSSSCSSPSCGAWPSSCPLEAARSWRQDQDQGARSGAAFSTCCASWLRLRPNSGRRPDQPHPEAQPVPLDRGSRHRLCGPGTINVRPVATAEVEQFDSTLEGLARTLLVKDFSLTAGGSQAAGASTGGAVTTGSSSSPRPAQDHFCDPSMAAYSYATTLPQRQQLSVRSPQRPQRKS